VKQKKHTVRHTCSTAVYSMNREWSVVLESQAGSRLAQYSTGKVNSTNPTSAASQYDLLLIHIQNSMCLPSRGTWLLR